MATRYVLFAVLASLANLATQRGILAINEESRMIFSAIAAGTLVGLVVKYLLDKRWIFFDRKTGVRTHGRKFTLYTATGIVTTAIFWGAELGFWHAFGTHTMREVGAIIGLTIGYALKYRLDRRFVFTSS